MITDKELAWAAGFFEGEGTVSIMRPTKRNHGSLCVSIVNTEKHLFEFFQSRWGGAMREMKMFGNRKAHGDGFFPPARRRCIWLIFRTFVFGQRMKERIFLGLAFQGNKWQQCTTQATNRSSKRLLEMNVWFYLQFRHINQRGTCTEADSFRKRD